MVTQVGTATGKLLLHGLLLLFGVAGIVSGLGLSAVGGFRELANSVAIQTDGVRSTGQVVRMNEWTESMERHRSPEIEVVDAEGRRVLKDLICAPFDCYPEFQFGMALPVAYPRDAPERFMADTVVGRWLSPAFLAFIGLMVAAMGCGALWAGGRGIVQDVSRFLTFLNS
jgi:Protein of unknown function (DUF3592)